ncbi:MAG: alpha/beta fold hydrolase [Mycobacteriales bacterium]
MSEQGGRLVRVHDTELYVVERGAADALPLLVLHGGPGLDHHEFAHYLDPLTDGGRYRLVLVDQRANGRSRRDAPPETWTLETMASDVSALAAGLGVERYAVLGHSFGAFVALQHAVDAVGAAAATVISGGVPSGRFLAAVEANLTAFEPVELREQVTASWARELDARTEEDVRQLLADQMPFHFADPLDPRIEEYNRVANAPAVYAPDVLRHFSAGYGLIDVEDRLGTVRHPVLVTAGRHDRTCPVEAAQAMAAGIPGAELVIFESSGHMTFVEEPDLYIAVVRDFLDRATG